MNFTNGRTPSKGERLKWTPLKDVRRVKLTRQLTTGRQLTSTELSKSKNVKKTKFLVP